jgi:hypothetical protein
MRKSDISAAMLALTGLAMALVGAIYVSTPWMCMAIIPVGFALAIKFRDRP